MNSEVVIGIMPGWHKVVGDIKHCGLWLRTGDKRGREDVLRHDDGDNNNKDDNGDDDDDDDDGDDTIDIEGL